MANNRPPATAGGRFFFAGASQAPVPPSFAAAMIPLGNPLLTLIGVWLGA
jgi:hypothetical protein